MSKTELFLQDAQLAYANAISAIFNCWVHDEDGGCDYDAVGQKRVVIYNSAMLIYQPMGNPKEEWSENGSILIMPTKESGIKLTEALVKKTKPLFQVVEDKLIDSYNGYVTKFKHWIEVIRPKNEIPNFKSITGIFDTIKFDKGILKFKWHIKCLWLGPCSYWYPIELINWYKSLPSYERYRISKYEIQRSKLEERIEDCKRNISGYRSTIKILHMTPDLEDSKDKIEDLNVLVEREKLYAYSIDRNIIELNSSMDNPEPIMTTYTDYDSEVEEWYEKYTDQKCRHYGECSKDMIADTITYEQAFPERKIESSISGKKRKSESLESSSKKQK